MALTPTGALDRRVRFERAGTAQDGNGVGVPGWALIEKAWAKILYGTSADRRTAAMQASGQVATFRVRATSQLRSVTAQDRVVEVAGSIAWAITAPPALIAGGAELEFTALRSG